MPSHDVEFLAAAVDDLNSLLDYVSQDLGAPQTAYALIDRIGARCRSLGAWPLRCRLRPELGDGMRTVPFKSVLIAYRAHENRVQIVRCFGQRQSYTGKSLD